MERGLVEYIFAKGVDTKTDAKLVAPGSLLILENGRFTKAGRIEKRNGNQRLVRTIFGSTSRILSALALARLGDELLLADASGELYSYAPSLQTWIDKGAVSPVSVRNRPLLRNTYQQSNPDAATKRGVTVYAWADTRGGIYADVVDEESGAKILADVNLSATGVRPRVVAVDTTILVAYIEGSDVKCRSVNIATPTEFAAAETLAADANPTFANQHLDVCASGFAEAAFFAYNTGSNNIKAGYIRRDGSVGTPANGGYPSLATVAESAFRAISIALEEDTGALFLFYSTGTDVRTAALFNDLTEKNAPSLVETITDAMNVTAARVGDVWTVFYEIFATKTYNRLVKSASVSLDGVASGVAVLQRGAGLASKAFVRDDHAHVAIVHDTTPSDEATPAAPFDPTSIAGLQVWLKADAGTFSDNGATVPDVNLDDPVRVWQDQSGNGNHVAKDTTAIYYTPAAAPSGLPAIRYDGAHGHENNTFTINQPSTVFVVWKPTNVTGTRNVYDGLNSGAVRQTVRMDGGKHSIYAGTIVDGAALTINEWLVSSAIFSGAASRLEKNGVDDPGVTNAGANNQDGIDIGVGFDGGLLGYIAEILVYDTALSDGDRANVVAYLQARWGV